MNKHFLKSMIVMIGLQSMVIVPLDATGFDTDAQDQEIQGILVDPEQDESLIDRSDLAPDSEDRTTEIAVNTPLWNFRLETDFWLVQTVIGVGLFLVVYKWYKNDSAK